mmetsp:Transcript_29359/g.71558  ORF Transcript_29359/g.71558 Transcript_29359/m.71558 type:complete len:90 (+) Transcript_29359:309-578(+)
MGSQWMSNRTFTFLGTKLGVREDGHLGPGLALVLTLAQALALTLATQALAHLQGRKRMPQSFLHLVQAEASHQYIVNSGNLGKCAAVRT